MDIAVLPSITQRSSPFQFSFTIRNPSPTSYLFLRPARPPPHIHISNLKPQLHIAVNSQVVRARGYRRQWGSTSPSKHVPFPPTPLPSGSCVISCIFCCYDILIPLTIQGWFFTSQGGFLNRLVMPHLLFLVLIRLLNPLTSFCCFFL